MPFVIQRIDQGGGYVARPGNKSSYTQRIEDARPFQTREEAERDACGNERVIDTLDLFRR